MNVESMAVDSIIVDNMTVDRMAVDSMTAESIAVDSMTAESMAVDSMIVLDRLCGCISANYTRHDLRQRHYTLH
jgi:hypothetical protein